MRAMKRDTKSAVPHSGKKRSRESPPRSSASKKPQKVHASDEQARRFEAWANGRTAPQQQLSGQSPGSPGTGRPATPCFLRKPPGSPDLTACTTESKKSPVAKGSARGRRGAMLVTAAGGEAPPPAAPSPQRKQTAAGRAGCSPGRAARSPSAGSQRDQSPGSARQPMVQACSPAAHQETLAVQAKLPAELSTLLRMFGERHISYHMMKSSQPCARMTAGEEEGVQHLFALHGI